MSALVYDCKDAVERLVENLKAHGASDREIVSALKEKASEIQYNYWARYDW